MSKHPLHPVTRPELLDRIRALVARLPETSEKLAWGEATFRVGKAEKMFAMFSDNHHGDGRIAILCKAPPGVHEMLVEAEPERFFRPPYVGPSGWIGIRVDGRVVDWEEVADFLADAWRMTASRSLVAAADAKPATVKAKPPTKRGRRKA
ncbi:MAG: MmcQ/YjbR family DNA-binding protein [Deltaproteobacteria bacterium]|nr:MmcQ/YjbR family DNA-binding protein [Deltaproteobacteria bacterium]